MSGAVSLYSESLYPIQQDTSAECYFYLTNAYAKRGKLGFQICSPWPMTCSRFSLLLHLSHHGLKYPWSDSLVKHAPHFQHALRFCVSVIQTDTCHQVSSTPHQSFNHPPPQTTKWQRALNYNAS